MLKTERIFNLSRTTSSPKDPLPAPRIRSSCDACLKTKVKCSQTRVSCTRCTQQGRQCVYSQSRKVGRPSKAVGGSTSWSTDQQQRIAGDTRRKSKKQTHQRHKLPNSTQGNGLDQQHHENQTIEPVVIPSKAISTGHTTTTSTTTTTTPSLNTLVVQYPGSETRTDGEEVDVDTSSANDRGSLSLEESNPAPEPIVEFLTPLDCAFENVDWPSWESTFNVPTSFAPLVNYTQVPSPHHSYSGDPTYSDNSLAGQISPSNSDSRESQSGNLLFSPYPSPAQSVKGLFSTRPGNSINAGYIVEPCSTDLQSEHDLGAISSNKLTPSRTYESSLYSISSTSHRCTLQCHTKLTNQLTEMTELQVKGSNIALDVLLNLDSRVCKIREKILTCSFCLATPRLVQTLMLLTMILGDLLSVFERSCLSAMVNTSATSPTVGSSQFTSRLHNHFRSSLGPLTIGDVQLDEALKVAFSRRLVSMYLNRQLLVVQQLDDLLGKGDRGNVRFKITQELLIDVSKRIESFIAFMALKDVLEISAVC